MAAIRNFLILAAVSSIGLVWSEGLGATSVALNQVILVVFLAVLALMGYRYFRENQLKWLVIKPWLRGVVVVCAAAIVFLVAAGPTLLSDRISGGALVALVAALGLVIVWIVYQSRRFP